MAAETTATELFRPVAIKGLLLPNRFVRSATWEGLAEADGSPSPALEKLMARLARGGVGLVISGHAFVAPEGRLGLRQLGAHEDRLVEGLARLARSVHEAGAVCQPEATKSAEATRGTEAAWSVETAQREEATPGPKVALQLTHGGLWAGEAPGTEVPLGPSPRLTPSGPVGRALDSSEIKALPLAFARAAKRVQEAGFDAVQLHAAHGYLLSSFLSPFFNRRKDAYGGDLARRHRLVVEVIEAVREAVGSAYPVFIKINAADFLGGGLTEEEMLEGAPLLEAAGIDGFELSGGTGLSSDYRPIRSGKAVVEGPEVYYERAALKLKQRVRVPVMLVGGIRSLEAAERVIAGGAADLVSLSRPLICEPELIARWQRGDRRPAACRSCNRCYFRGFAGEVVRCANKKALAEAGERAGL